MHACPSDAKIGSDGELLILVGGGTGPDLEFGALGCGTVWDV